MFFIIFFLPLAQGMVVDGEYTKELMDLYRNMSQQQQSTTDMPVWRREPPIVQAPFPNFPLIQLCKEKPTEGDVYGHVLCWGMFALYILLVLSLVLYQLRSFLWLKTNLPKKQKEDNGHSANNQNIEGKSGDEPNFSRMFSV